MMSGANKNMSNNPSNVNVTNKKLPHLSKASKIKPPNTENPSTSRREAQSPASIKQYLAPPSAPIKTIYVKRHVRDHELKKLQEMQEKIKNITQLLDEMDLYSLPTSGARLVERMNRLNIEVQHQEERLGNMIVEPDTPAPQYVAQNGSDKDLSWEDIQKASNAVHPSSFAKQAVAAHMSEKNLTMDCLRYFHDSIASRPLETTLATSPRIMVSKLMPYQLHALAWLKWRETQRPCGGILADDMGLGKTITMISLMASEKKYRLGYDDYYDDMGGPSVRHNLSRGGTLVVCPASLIQQWVSEVKKHCAPYALSTCLHHGSARLTQPHRLATFDIVVTTYNILQKDAEKNGVLMRVQWRRVILDEAHIIRNYKSATSMAVCCIRSKYRWCITGTPIHNKDMDLFALLKFLHCYPFDELRMWKKWIDNKSQGGRDCRNMIMRCIFLRRTKVQLQQKGQLDFLPSHTQHLIEVMLNEQEMNVYQKVLGLSKSLFTQFLHQNAKWPRYQSKKQVAKHRQMYRLIMAQKDVKPINPHEILVLILRLRQLCCHCGLITAMLDEESEALPADPTSANLLQELNRLSLESSSFNGKSGNNRDDVDVAEPQEYVSATEAIQAVLSLNNPVFELTRASSKIQAVMKCLNDNVFTNEGDKAVVVSQWMSVLRLVEAELSKLGVRSVTLSGAVSVPARGALVDAINDSRSDVKVMLLSFCVGGLGINLCGANHLLLLDLHWNPQMEKQAQDRIYRLGQTKDVHIYRFVCMGTIEQTIKELQQAKLNVAENVMTGAENHGAATLSIDDLKRILVM